MYRVPFPFSFQILAALTLASSLFSLAFAYTMQYGFGFQPCILCLYQRPPYFLAAALAILALILLPRQKQTAYAVLALCVLLFLIESALAFYQVGVEYHWWRGFTGCSGPDPETMTTAEYLAALESAPIVRCDIVQFSIFGISMAGMNAVWALSLGVALTLGLIKTRA